MAKYNVPLNEDQYNIKTSAEHDGSKWINRVKAQEIEDALATLLTKTGFDAKADIKMSALRDAITAAGANAKTLKDLHDKLTSLETEIKAIKDTASIPEYNWFTTDGRPTPKEPTKPAIGVEVDADTMEITGLLWNGQEWEAR